MELREIRRISFEKSIGINYVCKDERITKAINELYILFKDEVIMKGGTALNRAFIKENGRFSEDIDVDFITKDFKAAKKFIEDTMKAFKGFKVEKPRLMHKTLRFDCGYENELAHKDKIRVEFNLSHPKLIGEVKLTSLESPIISDRTNIFNIYSFESSIARKLLALFQREEGKDIYDLFYSLKKDFDKKKVIRFTREMCKFYEVEYKTFFQKLLEKFGQFEANCKYLGNSTNHYLTKDNMLDWKFIINELKQEIWEIMRV